MNLKYSQVAQLSNFSNEKMVSLIKNKVAESENAAVALVFDDRLVILNEDKEDFYTVDYRIKDKALHLENWEQIQMIPDNDSRLEDLSGRFFDPQIKEEITTSDLVNAFKLKYSNEPVRSLINKTAIEKKSIVESNSRIKALREVRKARNIVSDDINDIVNDPKIKAMYVKLGEDSPVQGSITSINFKSPISVTLFEEESNKVINLSEKKKCKTRSGNIKKKVKNMWTSESFKDELKSFLENLSESDDAKKTLESFVNQHIEILVLEEVELEDLILKTALMIGESKKSDQLVDLFKEYYNLEETQTARSEFISRNKLNEEDEPEGLEPDGAEPEDDKEDDKEEKKASEKETTIDEDSIVKIVKVMSKIKDALDEKTMEAKYIDSFIEALEDAKVGSIGEGKLKEILDFLNTIYDQAQENKETEED